MAALTNINVPTLVPAGAPTTNACTAGPDTIPVQAFGRYKLRFANTGGAPVTVTIDDPVSQNPGNATQFNPDVALATVPATTGIRESTIDVARFRDPATGNITLTYSVTPTMTVQVDGPF